MGANVGTPITSTLVAFGNVAHPKEFRNAMARHFIFNKSRVSYVMNGLNEIKKFSNP